MTTPNIEELMARNLFQRQNATAKPDVFLAADNIAVLQSQAKRIKDLELLVKVKNKPICDYQELIAERDTLRAQLAEIAATEPTYYLGGGRLYGDKTSALFDNSKNAITELFTRPMPAQDVTELVKDAERYRHAKLYNLLNGWNDENLDRDVAIHKALSKYKGAK